MTTPQYRIRVLTAEERRQLEEDVKRVADAEEEKHTAPPTRAPGWKGAIVAGAARVRATFTRENLSRAWEASAGFAKLAARYGLEEARAALQREIKARIGRVLGGRNSDK